MCVCVCAEKQIRYNLPVRLSVEIYVFNLKLIQLKITNVLMHECAQYSVYVGVISSYSDLFNATFSISFQPCLL